MSLAAVAGLGQAARVMSRAPSPLPAGRAAVLTGAVTWWARLCGRGAAVGLARLRRRSSRSWVSLRSVAWVLGGATTGGSCEVGLPDSFRGRAAASR